MKLTIKKASPRSISSEGLVSSHLAESGRLHVIEPSGNIDLAEWIAHNRERIDELQQNIGAVLFRGFAVDSAPAFDRLLSVISGGGDCMVEDQKTHNQFVSDDEDVWFHNDYCDRALWPRWLVFWCEIAGASGETPFVDCAGIYRELPVALRERFESEGWILRRRFHPGVGVDARGFFKTQDAEEVRRQLGLLRAFDQHWDGDRLAGFSVRFKPAIPHPANGTMVWSNNIAFSNIEMIDEAVRGCLLRDYGADRLPVNTYWGDGSPISWSDLEVLRELYASNEVRFAWKRGDVLMLDNIRCAHGRRPLLGLHSVRVGSCDFHRCLNVFGSQVTSRKG